MAVTETKSNEPECGWRKGPLKDAYGWGGVVKAGEDPKHGFHFADFMGDKVEILLGDGKRERLKSHQVLWFNNCLGLPPTE